MADKEEHPGAFRFPEESEESRKGQEELEVAPPKVTSLPKDRADEDSTDAIDEFPVPPVRTSTSDALEDKT